jgi:TonB family protein
LQTKISIGALLALGLAMAPGDQALAASAKPADRPPDWLKRPSLQDLLTVWPKEAWKHGEGGEATISCEVNAQGSLINCSVLREAPPGSGFGAAALALSSQFLMKPALRDGSPVAGGKVNIPIRFIAPGTPTGSFIPGPLLEGPPRRVVTDILWSAAPSYAEVVAVYPAKARQEIKGGRVILDCAFNASSRFKRCEVLEEEPRGYGFAAAAQVLTKAFEGPPNPVGDGNFTNAHTQISVVFAPEMLDAKTPAIGRPKWAALPAGREFEKRFAPLARAAGVTSVRAVLNCTVAAGGALGDCSVTGEDPIGAGLGAAALELAPAFRLSIWTSEGLPVVGSAVQAPLRYKLPTGDKP